MEVQSQPLQNIMWAQIGVSQSPGNTGPRLTPEATAVSQTIYVGTNSITTNANGPLYNWVPMVIANWTAPAASSKYVAASSGWAVTTQLNYIPVIINWVTYNLLIKD